MVMGNDGSFSSARGRQKAVALKVVTRVAAAGMGSSPILVRAAKDGEIPGGMRLLLLVPKGNQSSRYNFD